MPGSAMETGLVGQRIAILLIGSNIPLDQALFAPVHFEPAVGVMLAQHARLTMLSLSTSLTIYNHNIFKKTPSAYRNA
jgi:hypothetical protein